MAGVAEPSEVSGGAAARIFLMPSTMSFTVRIERTSSSGIEILNAFSSSNSSVKTSSESMPSSCRLVSSVIFSAGNPLYGRQRGDHFFRYSIRHRNGSPREISASSNSLNARP